jgi:hypothetical protein
VARAIQQQIQAMMLREGSIVRLEPDYLEQLGGYFQEELGKPVEG